MDFKYKVMKDYDHIIEEKGNTFIALRKIAWNMDPNTEDVDESKIKLDLRKYYSTAEGGETMSKGVSFSDTAADELTKVLAETGYGKTEEIIVAIKDRDNFKEAIDIVFNDAAASEDSDDFFDPREMLFGKDEE